MAGLSRPCAKYVLQCVGVVLAHPPGVLLVWSWAVLGGGGGGRSGVKRPCDAVVGRGVELTAFVPSDKKMPVPKAVLPLSSPLPLCLHHCKI